MNVFFISGGSITIGGGTDAPGRRFNFKTGKWEPVPGWNPEQMVELGIALNILGLASRFKTPGLAEAVTRSVMDFTRKELGENLKDGGVLVVE